MPFILLYRKPALGPLELGKITQSFDLAFNSSSRSHSISSLESEYCYAIEWENEEPDMKKLQWLLSESLELSKTPFLSIDDDEIKASMKHSSSCNFLVEFGPRLSFTTAWSTNATSICHKCGLNGVKRIERSRRLKLKVNKAIDNVAHAKELKCFLNSIHDRMTETIYSVPFDEMFKLHCSNLKSAGWKTVDVIGEGIDALKSINKELGLAFDDFDLEFYTTMFRDDLKRNPTTVELFDISQSNSEHSRHWFFKGQIVVDGVQKTESLMELVQKTLDANKTNSVIAFSDNSSAIRGYKTRTFIPNDPTQPSQLVPTEVDYDITFTAETHNFPTGIAPFPGAETGTGGRLRDGHATGRGSLITAGTTGYSVGQLHIPGYYLPWEDKSLYYPSNMARPLQIVVEASNGASDYGNKFGEPVITGFARSFGLVLTDSEENTERREYIKPIMFTGGMGQMDHRHLIKEKPEAGMIVVKVGGPAYRIGLGGGAASSMVQGQNDEELDFNAVQRGDAETEQKLNRVIKACVELGDKNPIVSIHDQGAGGNANVLKELVDPAGARIEVRKIPLGDFTLSALEIWSAEYQENDALLIRKENADLFASICARESCVFAYVGTVTGDGIVTLYDEQDDSIPFNLPLEKVLGKMPRKTFYSKKFESLGTPLRLPKSLTLNSVLERVLRHLSVGSKRFLTTKVDRSVTGLIAQQQCVGPLHIPVADYGATAQGYWTVTGSATSIGEQPIKGLISPEAMARMTVGEALTNLVFAKISSSYQGEDTSEGALGTVAGALTNIKASGNWMWPAKMEGEADAIYRACDAMSQIMIALGISVDGGKDSLSMAAKSGHPEDPTEMVKTPGTLVVSLYGPMDDINVKVDPAIRRPGESTLIFIDLGMGKQRLGGSILAQSYQQIGDESPDLDDSAAFYRAWNAVQELIQNRLVLSGHDRSDGGLITTVLEMAFAGNCGLSLVPPSNYCVSEGDDIMSFVLKPWLNEELGIVLEIADDQLDKVLAFLATKNVDHVHVLGKTTVQNHITISTYTESGSESVLDESMTHLRDLWESTSFELEMLQANTSCVEQEKMGLASRRAPSFNLSFVPSPTPYVVLNSNSKPKVAVIREEGSNGDREMAAAFQCAGFDVWDINMNDLAMGKISLDAFQGVAFVGGFSYADVMDSAKGWAGGIKFNEKLFAEFDTFVNKREDTFTLGICNGCQLMGLLGYVPFPKRQLPQTKQPRFVHNTSGRFESRFTTVKILKSPSIMLHGMEGSVLGIWLSHGEGRVFFPETDLMNEVLDSGLAPVRYVDDNSEPTEKYPFNPNGSPHGIAALCSEDGRHLAIMPHSERTAWPHNWPWMPEDWRTAGHPCQSTSPWLHMFQNAYRWAISHQKE